MEVAATAGRERAGGAGAAPRGEKRGAGRLRRAERREGPPPSPKEMGEDERVGAYQPYGSSPKDAFFLRQQ